MLFIFSFQLINDFIRTFGILLIQINLATSFILCAEPTEVPPNFKTFIFRFVF